MKYAAREPSHYLVQAVDRALTILNAFARGDQEKGVSELSREVGLHPATVHRLLATLGHWRLVEQNPRTGKYRLGLKLFELGSLVVNALDVRKVAHPFLLEMMAKAGETAHLIVLDGGEIVFVDKVDSPNPFRMVSEIGKRLPAHCSAAGKALLAQHSEAELSRIFGQGTLAALTPNSIVSFDEFLRHLRRVRAQGYAVDDEETQVGLRCVGAPIHDHTGMGVAAVSVSGPVVRLTRRRLPTIAEMVRETALGISLSLGWSRSQAV